MAAAPGPLAVYREDLAHPGFSEDPVQAAAVQRLERLYRDLTAPPPGLVERLSGWLRRAPPQSRGLYLYGPVGRGKSYLMDLLYECVPGERKRRLHFHHFMQRVHGRRRELPPVPDPLQKIAAEWAARADLLCLDELQVRDIADAMILGPLLAALLEGGVRIVTTSNRHPDGLYENGLQRQRFLPTIELLKQRLELVPLDGDTDYRRRSLADQERYMLLEGEPARQALGQVFQRLVAGHANEEPLELDDRRVHPVAWTTDVVWFDFAELCEGRRSARDYLELAERFHTVLLEGVPRMDDRHSDAAHRFMTLVDVLYDHRLHMIVAAAAEPDQLYTGERHAFEFQRTVSRLLEMRARHYGNGRAA